MLRLQTIFLVLTLSFGTYFFASAQTKPATQTVSTDASGSFVKKRYSVKGQWEWAAIDDGEQSIRFTPEFKTKSGPDLKVYLSPVSIEDATRETATLGSLKIGVLKSNKGQQTYLIPAGTDLTKYKSVLIHCESYSVLWGGFDIPQ